MEKSRGCIHKVTQMLLALEYQTRYQINAKTQAFKEMVRYADYLIYIYS